MNGKITAWSLKVAENEHQFKAVDESQKSFVVRDTMLEEIDREFLTGLKKLGTYDARTTQCDLVTRATTCRMTTRVRSRGKDTKPAREHARKERTDQGCGIVEEELTNGRVAEEMTEERKEVRRTRRAEREPREVGDA